MGKSIRFAGVLAAGLLSGGAWAHEAGLAKPDPVLQQIVEGMPRGERQEVRVMTATFKPGDRTVFHTHRSPVTVYILQGAFTLELEGRDTDTILKGLLEKIEAPRK